MNTDQLIAKLDELIAATRSAAIPANMRWLSAESMAAMLDMSPVAWFSSTLFQAASEHLAVLARWSSDEGLP